jgi:hypothetical protein
MLGVLAVFTGDLFAFLFYNYCDYFRRLGSVEVEKSAPTRYRCFNQIRFGIPLDGEPSPALSADDRRVFWNEGSFMVDHSPTVTDRNLEATTTISLKREPACFAFLCDNAESPPLPVDSIHVDLASADYFGGRASLWATLEIRSGANNDKPMTVLGFDETFLRPFSRALIEAATTRVAHRMSVVVDAQAAAPRHRVVEYVTGGGSPLQELVLTPHDNVVLVAATAAPGEPEETLFQLPRTDSFLRAFAKMAYQADQSLRDTLVDLERIGRSRRAAAE